MRSKVVLIKGFAMVSPKITISPYQRINADHVVFMAALRYPQFLPYTFTCFDPDLIEIRSRINEILAHWAAEDHEHVLAAEYANLAIERGSEDIKAVEGRSLQTQWFYDTVRSFHRHFGQTVIDCEVYEREKETWMAVDGKELELATAIEMLRPHPALG